MTADQTTIMDATPQSGFTHMPPAIKAHVAAFEVVMHIAAAQQQFARELLRLNPFLRPFL